MSRRHAVLGCLVILSRTLGPHPHLRLAPLRRGAHAPATRLGMGARGFVNFNLWGGAGTMRV